MRQRRPFAARKRGLMWAASTQISKQGRVMAIVVLQPGLIAALL
jgi:hypothetical protein